MINFIDLTYDLVGHSIDLVNSKHDLVDVKINFIDFTHDLVGNSISAID